MSGGLGGVEDVLDGIEHARRAGLAPIKINAVIQRGLNDHTALDLVERFRGTGVIVRFIEYMDVGNRNHWQPGARRALERAGRAHRRSAGRSQPLERNYRGEVAERYAFEDGAGEVGFISSVTQPFCGDCSRARLSSDGVFYTCLFATQGTDLRDALRGGASDDELLRADPQRLDRDARDRYSELRASICASAGPAAEDRDVLHRRLTWQMRGRLTHLDAANRPTMVDVGAKDGDQRKAAAEAHASNCRAPVARALQRSGHRTKKGPVFDTAIIAGVMAAKRTHELIPFCHPLALDKLQRRDRDGPRRHARHSSAACPCITRPASRWRR